MTENTVIAWDGARASRVRQEHQAKVSRLIGVCESVESFFPRPRDVGAFLVTPQLALGNREPCGLIRFQGSLGAEVVVQLIREDVHRAEQLKAELDLTAILNDDGSWQALRDGLSDNALRRLDTEAQALDTLTLTRGSRDMLT